MPASSSALAWTNTYLEPSSGAMKPKPLAVLKNLTVPEIRIVILSRWGAVSLANEGFHAWPRQLSLGKVTRPIAAKCLNQKRGRNPVIKPAPHIWLGVPGNTSKAGSGRRATWTLDRHAVRHRR